MVRRRYSGTRTSLRDLEPAQKVRAKAMTEAECQRGVEASLDTFGWTWVHHPDSRRMKGTKGVPDIVAIRDGYTLWIECKNQSRARTPEQRHWHDEIQTIIDTGAPVEYMLWRPSHLLSGEVDEVLSW